MGACVLWGVHMACVIQSSVTGLAVTIGKWCLILLGPFEKAYDVSQDSVPRDARGRLYPPCRRGWGTSINSPELLGCTYVGTHQTLNTHYSIKEALVQKARGTP